MLCMCGMDSCCDYDAGYELPGMGGMDPGRTDKTFLALHISPVNIGEGNTGTITERIRTLRVIVLAQEKDSIEYNKLITLEEKGFTASSFSYSMILPTVPGHKKLYFIANEESVNINEESVNIEGEGKLSDWLDKFQPGTDKVVDFETQIKGVYFSPEYTPDENGNIYLPYTSYYGNLEAIEGAEAKEITAYLVPVATKFIFNFTNSREKTVSVKGISLESINSDNYLFAQVGQIDSCKTFEEETDLYWVDWLAKVSKESQKHLGSSQNGSFNEKYGWISDYEMPSTEANKYVFVDEKEVLTIPGLTSDGTSDPQTVTVGPFYVPESKYLLKKDDTTDDDAPPSGEQVYYLTMGLEDTVDGKTAPDFTHVPIPNLRALFRNTYVIINVFMSQGDVKVYAEIQDWNHKKINGWVTEGQKP